MEHLFSKLRQRGGFNPNPTARMVRLAIRHILSTGYIQTSDKGNVQCSESEALINKPTKIVKTVENCLHKTNVTAADEEDVDEEDVESNIDRYIDMLGECEDVKMEQKNINSSYDENAVTYFAGYVARRCFEKTNCNECRTAMLKTPMDDASANEKYIEYHEYPNIDEDAPAVIKLARPTNRFIDIMKTQLKAFNLKWQHHWASRKILEKLVNEGIFATNVMHAGWFDINDKCYNHHVKALKFLMTVKIYSRTRYNNHATKTSKKFDRKIKNVSNQ